ncbi:MAG: flavin reductase family protein [Clostridia bacterium]|nr:flavin reductase family protein [Clostridia bacterium]
MARKELKPGALVAPVPPAIVTVGDSEKYNMLTVAWCGILATHPARTYVSVRPSRFSHPMLMRSKEFVINLPRASMAREVDYIGIYTGAKVDKFERTGLHPIPSTVVSVPSVLECPVAIECRVVEVIPMGTHDVFIADIVGVSCDEAIMDEKGRMCFDRADLLAYAHGEYYALGERLGEFGFSTKKSTPKSGKPTAKGGKKESASTVVSGAAKAPKSEKVKGDSRGGKSHPVSENEDKEGEKRPFYLDAPGYKRRRK